MSTLLSSSPVQIPPPAADDATQLDESPRNPNTTGGRRPAPAASVVLVSVARMCCLAIGMGLLTGLGESLYWWLQSAIQGPYDRWGPLILWLSPPVQVVTMIIWSLPLLLLSRLHHARLDVAQSIAWLAFPAALNLLLLCESLHVLASLLLALGIAVQAHALAQRRQKPILRVCRGAWVPLGFAWAVCFATVHGHARVTEHFAVSRLSPAVADAPNVLLVVIDTLSADVLRLGAESEAHTTTAETPNLAKFAHEGFEFRQAIAPSPWTLPSHASLFTGRPPRELEVGWTSGLDRRFPTLAEALRERGYHTAGFVANTFFASRQSGLQRGFLHYEDQQLSVARMLHATSLLRAVASCWPENRHPDYIKTVGRKSADQAISAYLAWLDNVHARTRKPHPHFAFINLFDAHDPFTPPARKFCSEAAQSPDARYLIQRWWGWNKSRLSPRYRNHVQRAYLDCVEYIDDRLGMLFAELRSRGAWDNTIVVITSDHGEHFGDHGLYGHGNSLYQAVVHVPLLMRWTGHIPAGGHCDTHVSLADVPATILDLVDKRGHTDSVADTGSQQPATRKASQLPGYALNSLWAPTPGQNERPVACSVSGPWGIAPSHGCSPTFRGPMKAVIAGGWKYIAIGEKEEELYDLRHDPREERNLSADPQTQSQLQRLRRSL